jgi:murein hydrolase activator
VARAGIIGVLSLLSLALVSMLTIDIVAHAQAVPDARKIIDKARAEERSVLDGLTQIDTELAGIQTELEGLKERMTELDSSRIRHADEVASANAILAKRRNAVVRRLGSLYRLERRGLARVIFGSDDASELRRLMRYLNSLVATDVDQLDEYSASLDIRARSQTALDQDISSIDAARTDLQIKESELRDRRSRRVALLENIRDEKDLALRALAEQARAQQGLGTRLQAPAQVAPQDALTSVPFRSLHGKLPWPTSGRVIRRYGGYKDPYTGQMARSLGIVIAAEYGTPFRAVADGVVKMAGMLRSYGQTVAIGHGPYTTVYANASAIHVRKGQAVRAGQRLGSVGNSGLTQGSQNVLTFEVRYNNSAQDPMPWLSGR